MKNLEGNFFEDFHVGQDIQHPTPRTITAGDISLYLAFYGSRFAPQSSDEFSRGLGLRHAPVDDLLTFHVVFGKTVPDLSLNAVANLGYADCRFLRQVFVGDTLRASSEVIGLKENSSGKTGNVYVRTTGFNQRGDIVLEYVRWVMVRKKGAAPTGANHVPTLPSVVTADRLVPPNGVDLALYNSGLAGSPFLWDDYTVGERINHVDGITIEAAEHMMATRLYQNTARVHFNRHLEAQGRLGERIVYGGHVISIARALSFNGLGNAAFILAINGGRHVAPSIAGDTVYAWSEVLDKAELPDRRDAGALRLRLVALKNESSEGFSYKLDDERYHPAVILDLDYWVLLPRH